jgi:hypothetical protein
MLFRPPRMQRDDDLQREHPQDGPSPRDGDGGELVITQGATGYWFVQRGDIALQGAMTRHAAERERERMVRLAGRSVRRTRALVRS